MVIQLRGFGGAFFMAFLCIFIFGKTPFAEIDTLGRMLLCSALTLQLFYIVQGICDRFGIQFPRLHELRVQVKRNITTDPVFPWILLGTTMLGAVGFAYWHFGCHWAGEWLGLVSTLCFIVMCTRIANDYQVALSAKSRGHQDRGAMTKMTILILAILGGASLAIGSLLLHLNLHHFFASCAAIGGLFDLFCALVIGITISNPHHSQVNAVDESQSST